MPRRGAAGGGGRKRGGGGSGGSGGKKGEVVHAKSPAEFFAEHQNIAGFDNPGKSLYTTIRELVENALDAAESIERLPEVRVLVEELETATFAKLRGLPPDAVADEGVEGGGGGGGRSSQSYFRVTVEDNGCGMPHASIPEMLGRVLSGSKYGVRQTRGKFGLGAKMALIWAKKSTGLPIEVKSAHLPTAASASRGRAPSTVSRCRLDIDIVANAPNVLEHVEEENTEGFEGTRLVLVVGGLWGSYRSRLLQYMQQLAVITPYAELSLEYKCPASPSREFAFAWHRRSTRVPPPAKEVLHHPSSVNNLLVGQLADRFAASSSAPTLLRFLSSCFAQVSRSQAREMVQLVGNVGLQEESLVSELDQRQIHAITQQLREWPVDPPDGSCLSPAGEYNLRLGIMKELAPALVATHTAPVGVVEGHPFLVEAGVSIGGRAADGIAVHRFANRIPLLFEGGGDVVTRTATQRLKWAQYKIDHRRDKVGVFVSIVSTKVPFKGTGKEYIGDDIFEIQHAVRGALQACCSQLRVKLARRNALKEQADRRKNLVRYIPDVTRSVLAVLGEARRRRDAKGDVVDPFPKRRRVLERLDRGEVTEALLDAKLRSAVAAADDAAALDSAMRNATSAAAASAADGEGDAKYKVRVLPETEVASLPVYTLPAGGVAVRWLPDALVASMMKSSQGTEDDE